jgi:hypothetical protein
MRHHPYIVVFSVYVFIAFFLACDDDRSSPPDTGDNNRIFRIVIKWYGDDMANRQELAMRDRIAQRIVQEKIGKIIRLGTGMGWMDIVVTVKASESIVVKLNQIVNELVPDSGYMIHIGKM